MIRVWYVMVLVGFGGVLGNSANAALEGSADFDFNGEVNELDFNIWETNFPTLSGASLADGDADSNGTVDGNDFLLWQVQYLPSEVAPQEGGGGGGLSVATTPEPATSSLLAIAVAGILARRRRG